MTRIILSTSNVVSGGPSIFQRSVLKSNTELVNGLRASISAARHAVSRRSNGQTDGTTKPAPPWRAWTSQHGADIDVPSRDAIRSGLKEKRSSYEITVKIFFLRTQSASHRARQIQEALQFVLDDLQIASIDLVVVSFPGIVYDLDAGTEEPVSGDNGTEDQDGGIPEDLDSMSSTWSCLEEQHDRGVVDKLGLAEFGPERLESFLGKIRIPPAVDQISVNDVCDVPQDVISYAQKAGVDLQIHYDCINILPQGTVRQLLGSNDGGAGILSGDDGGDGLKGDIRPQWVVKYTALVKARGVIESKGYFAMAELVDD